MPEWLAFLMALAINAIYSLGMVLQKKGIGWQTKGRVHDLAWRRERQVWLLGFLMVIIIPFLNFIALYSLSPVIIGSMAGSCVVFTAFFSALILKAKLGLREIAASAVLFAGIILFAIFTGTEDSTNWSRPFFVMTWLFPFAGAGSGWLLMRIRMRGRTLPGNTGPFQSNPYGALMGAATGALGGALIIIMKLFQIECSTDLLRYPADDFHVCAYIRRDHGTVFNAGRLPAWLNQRCYRCDIWESAGLSGHRGLAHFFYDTPSSAVSWFRCDLYFGIRTCLYPSRQ